MAMNQKHYIIRGTVAALLTPRGEGGAPDLESFGKLVNFVVERGVSGVAVGGATAEYVRLDEGDRMALVEAAVGATSGRATVIAAVGGADAASSLRMAADAARVGASGLLVPPPFFFPYGAAEVESFYRALAREVELPIVIYNLPSFTSVVPMDVAARLIESEERIVGIKDSSGVIENLPKLREMTKAHMVRMVGNDAVLVEALRRRICDGTISGVAGVLPELTAAVVSHGLAGEEEGLNVAAHLLDQLLPRLGPFATPWGLKIIADERGLAPAEYPIPPSSGTAAQIEEFRAWFTPWWQEAEATLAQLPDPAPLASLGSTSRSDG